ncbi:helix-turn-helix domain-containing protein [Clostridiaceae bacterium UIB06]|uniref:Helix-turn-helix domain-containing protein n=1 Tax=Clostridium thailandense TaxID=2794346 RepID=A0A949X4J1_9CLOT|nr:helix-turn-helix domain-containing protein [Clostridium thailandense]MBV7276589.1 helix-turn-helix domain-containing protein [Clostridium thailandense]MCH5136122.1 helix-turn-helix domain-containing protein [Clostridiaceae bacterium UIB06]
MRREYIEHASEKPVIISLANINKYPIHWHNSIEILYVLKGKLDVIIGSDKYELIEKDIEIINLDEAHMILSDDKDNRVLIFHIDPFFFEKYYSDINNMFFFTNTTDEKAQESDQYDELRVFLCKIVCEEVQKQDNYDEEIESILIDLLYHLINNFHYLMYEKENIKENEEQFERYHRIIKYIFNNYDNNITLQEIAEKEFLSTHYLSHEIKDATGQSFTDLINLTRVEEAAKLLLDTDKTISEITEDIGFSHTRYFNKHFKIHYKYTPLQYRKKFKVDAENFNRQKVIKFYDLKESFDYITYYLEDYDRFNYEDKVTKININMGNDIGEFKKIFKKIVNVGDAFDLLLEDNKDILELIQEEIGFEYARLLNVFSQDMCVFPSSKFYNWNRTRDVFEFLETINLKPLIVLDDKGFDFEDFLEAIKSFLDYFGELDNLDLSYFKFQFSSTIKEDVINKVTEILNIYKLEITKEYFYAEDNVDLIYDTAYMLPYIINNVVNETGFQDFLRAFDVLDKQVNLTNEVFFGYPGLINDKGIKKPSYYAYYLLNKLGDILVAKDKGYIVTKSYKEYQILLYSYHDGIDKLIPFKSFSKLRGIKNAAVKKLSLNIVNIPSAIRITNYEISEKVGSSYNYWVDMGKPKRLNKEEKEILHKASFPNIYFKNFRKSAIFNLQAKLKGYGALLILIKEA